MGSSRIFLVGSGRAFKAYPPIRCLWGSEIFLSCLWTAVRPLYPHLVTPLIRTSFKMSSWFILRLLPLLGFVVASSALSMDPSPALHRVNARFVDDRPGDGTSSCSYYHVRSSDDTKTYLRIFLELAAADRWTPEECNVEFLERLLQISDYYISERILNIQLPGFRWSHDEPEFKDGRCYIRAVSEDLSWMNTVLPCAKPNFRGPKSQHCVCFSPFPHCNKKLICHRMTSRKAELWFG